MSYDTKPIDFSSKSDGLFGTIEGEFEGFDEQGVKVGEKIVATNFSPFK